MPRPDHLRAWRVVTSAARRSVAPTLAMLLATTAGAHVVVQPADAAASAPPEVFVHHPVGDEIELGAFVDAVRRCFGGASAVVRVDGADHYRVYGFAAVSAGAYASGGPAVFAGAMQRARLDAVSSAADYLLGVDVWMEASAASAVASASASGAGAISDRERALVREAIGTSTAGFLPGGRVHETLVVDLGAEHGYCVTVAYDVPLGRR